MFLMDMGIYELREAMRRGNGLYISEEKGDSETDLKRKLGDAYEETVLCSLMMMLMITRMTLDH